MRRRLTHSHRPPPIPKSPHGDAAAAAGDIFFRTARTPPPPSPNSVEVAKQAKLYNRNGPSSSSSGLRRYHLAKDQRVFGGPTTVAARSLARSAAASPRPSPKALFSPPKVITNNRWIDWAENEAAAATLGPRRCHFTPSNQGGQKASGISIIIIIITATASNSLSSTFRTKGISVIASGTSGRTNAFNIFAFQLLNISPF
ncbi:hypothetical protein GPALN_012421 [Globodera pallida]|nr:hypothetical protein GPALN_012421 [Globodera pallida]